jgi:hypothetical protein
MDPVCHRCGTTLNSAEELFCPHCGAPQLRYEASEEPGPSPAFPQQAASGRNLEVVSWKAAVVSALLVAVPVGLLSSLLNFGSLWVICGGIATVSLYRRRVGVPPSGRTGWRIGGLLGVLAAFISTAIYSLKLVIERYALHRGELDQQIHTVAQQFAEQVNHSDPQTAAALAQLSHFWLSPDGTAAIVLGGAVVSALLMVVFAAAGGAIGARITSLGNSTQRSS